MLNQEYSNLDFLYANNNLKVFNGDEFTILFKYNIPTRNIKIFSDFFRNTY